jgi:plasmid maintenance system antidote protein VapI
MNKELKGEIIKRYGSQFAFAHAIGWHEASISRVIRGHHVLDDDTKRRWSEVLGVSVKILFPEVEENGR